MQAFIQYLKKNIPKIPTFYKEYNEAIEYIILNRGKLFRPKLLLSIVKAYEPLLLESSFKIAFALELFHTYSLIHDDLPAMDNSSTRRGKKTLHVLYNDALAILIGDALNTYAFELISTSALRDDVKIKLIKLLSQNGGISGMVLGQAIDLAYEKKKLTLEQLKELHINKTAKLIAASLAMGAVIVDLPKELQKKLYEFGIDLGLLFQVQDDILDVISNENELGKPVNKDIDKNTYTTLLGVEGAIEYANNLANSLQDKLNEFEAPLQAALKEVLDKYLFRHQK